VPLQIQALFKTVQQTAPVALPQTTTANILVVSGDVYVFALTGVVTVTIGAVANATKLQAVATGLTAVDLCATLDINGLLAGNTFAPITSFATGLPSLVNGVGIGVTPTSFFMGAGGVIRVNCAGSDGGTGRIRWSCAYLPMSSGASIVSA